ncbi:MAG TPA: Ig-like domain-containing protein [Thermodesulfobacteriota bacterium]|nr:Ig-like domain-containing protein [Thermodesulfobacteriota bacterium]
MKKWLGMLILISVFVLGMRPCAMAQNEIQMRVNMFKDVSSSGEVYGINFELVGDRLKNAARIFIDGPRGKRVWVNNAVDLNQILLSAVDLSIDQFDRWFPEGDYLISYSPPAIGKLKVRMTRNFPSTPAIVNPTQGAVNVSLNPLIAWGPLTNILSLRLMVKDRAGLEFSIELPTNSTSYRLPVNLLKPNTQYELSLQVTAADSGGNGFLTTTSLISFTTEAE